MSKFCFILLPGFLLLFSCTLAPVPRTPTVDPGSTLHVYLQPLPQEAQSLTMTIEALSARAVDGQLIPLLEEPLVLQPGQLIGRQIKLLARKLPAGPYLGIDLTISRATLETDLGSMDLLVNSEAQQVGEEFRIEPDQAICLLLSLNPDRLVTDGFRLTAGFSLWKPLPPLPGLKGMVSQPLNGTLTLFEKKTASVYSVMAIGRQPAGLDLNQRARRVFVALTEENAIAVVDLVQERIERKVRLRNGDRPLDLVLSGDGSILLVKNSDSSSISILNADTLVERGRITFSTRPGDIFTGHNNPWAYVLLPETNSVAVIDIQRAVVVASVDLLETPIRGVNSGDNQKLYLLTKDSSDLLVLDAQSLKVESRILVGFGARCLAVNRKTAGVYVGLANGEIIVLDPQLGLPIDSFHTNKDVRDIAFDFEQNSLFVLTGRKGSLEKFDLVSKKRLATLEMGGVSQNFVVMGEK